MQKLDGVSMYHMRHVCDGISVYVFAKSFCVLVCV